MFEMKVNVEITSPDMTAAINNLAKAIEKFGSPVVTPIVTKTEVHKPVNPTPAPTPVQTEPVAPVNPTPTPVQAATPVTNPMPVPTVAPTPAPQPVPAQPQKAITINMLAAAGAPLVDQGKMPQLMALLAKYGVQAITQLTPDKYDAFATDLRAIGAQI